MRCRTLGLCGRAVVAVKLYHVTEGKGGGKVLLAEANHKEQGGHFVARVGFQNGAVLNDTSSCQDRKTCSRAYAYVIQPVSTLARS